MKIGLYSITYLGLWYRGRALTIEEVIERARRFGYDGVEIDGKRPHGNPVDLPELKDAQISRLVGTHEQRLATIAHGDGVGTTHIPAQPGRARSGKTVTTVRTDR